MRPLVALVLGCALVASSTTASSLHIHEYAGHDHPDHHHGPAAHEHDHSEPVHPEHHADDHQPAIEAESCNPSRHAVSFSIGCIYVPQMQVVLAELPGPPVALQSGPMRSAVPITDVRVHGPPFDARIPSRAPPVIPPA